MKLYTDYLFFTDDFIPVARCGSRLTWHVKQAPKQSSHLPSSKQTYLLITVLKVISHRKKQ